MSSWSGLCVRAASAITRLTSPGRRAFISVRISVSSLRFLAIELPAFELSSWAPTGLDDAQPLKRSPHQDRLYHCLARPRGERHHLCLSYGMIGSGVKPTPSARWVLSALIR